MPTAYNKETGELLVLTDGQWSPPQMAQNPQTGQKIYLADGEWKPVPALAAMSERDRNIETSRMVPQAQRALEQGATLGFADEVAAAGAATGQFLKNLPQGLSAAAEAAGKRYDEKLGAERGRISEFRQESPVQNAALQTLGGLVMGPQLTKMGAAAAPMRPPQAGAAPTLGQTMMQAGTGAALTGGVAGFGGGEGGFGNRMEDAATTAAIAGAVGAATPLALKAAGQGTDLLRNMFNSGNADEQAQQLVLRALERDKVTPSFAQSGKPEALVDLGGENVRGLARGAASLPGPAREMTQNFVATRQAGQGGRIADDVAAAISPNTNYAGTIDDLMASRARQAQPLYDRVMRPDAVVPDEKFAALAQDPYIAQTIGKVRENPLYGMADLPPNSLPVLDAAKKQLDDLIGAARRSGANNEARLLSQKKDAIVALADDAFPDYRLAREAWSGPTQSAEALELGRNILKESADLTAKAIKDMPTGDREFFKAGVVRAIKDAADNAPDGADITKRFFGKPALRERLRAAFDTDAAFKAFEDAVGREAQMFRNAQQINPRAGSPTAIIAEEQADIRKNPVVQFMSDTFGPGGGVMRGIGGAAERLYDRGRGINSNTSEALAKLLLETDPQKLSQIGTGLAGQRMIDQQKAIEMARQLGLIGKAEGVAIGNF